MSTFAILLLCVQACLFQSALSCGCGSKAPAFSYGIGRGYGAGAGCGSAGYTAVGSGNMFLDGELGVTGLTTVTGSVPVLGGLSFGGLVPASGLTTISGGCAYPQPATYGASSLGSAIAGAEIAGFNAGLSSASFAAPKPGCGCGRIFY